MAVSHCVTWFQTQLILTACQIRYHGHCGVSIALDRRGYLEYRMMSRICQLVLVWFKNKCMPGRACVEPSSSCVRPPLTSHKPPSPGPIPRLSWYQNFNRVFKIGAKFSLHQISLFLVSHVPKFASPGTFHVADRETQFGNNMNPPGGEWGWAARS